MNKNNILIFIAGLAIGVAGFAAVKKMPHYHDRFCPLSVFGKCAHHRAAQVTSEAPILDDSDASSDITASADVGSNTAAADNAVRYGEKTEILTLQGNFGTLEIYNPHPETKQGLELRLNDTVLLDNDWVDIFYAAPNASAPALALAYNDCSGSACGNGAVSFADLKTTPVFFATIPILGRQHTHIEKSKTDDTLFFIKGLSRQLTDALGDPMALTYQYDRATQKLELLGRYASSYKGMEYAWQILGDRKARTIFLSQMDNATFKAWRADMATSSPIRHAAQNRYIIGEGMAPHSGGEQSGFFIIDTLTNQFMAGHYNKGKTTFYGTLKRDDLIPFGTEALNALDEKYGLQIANKDIEGDIYAPH